MERPEITSSPLKKPRSYLIQKAQFGKGVVCSVYMRGQLYQKIFRSSFTQVYYNCCDQFDVGLTNYHNLEHY